MPSTRFFSSSQRFAFVRSRRLLILLGNNAAYFSEIPLDRPAVLLGRRLVASLLQVVAQLRDQLVPVGKLRALRQRRGAIDLCVLQRAGKCPLVRFVQLGLGLLGVLLVL